MAQLPTYWGIIRPLTNRHLLGVANHLLALRCKYCISNLNLSQHHSEGRKLCTRQKTAKKHNPLGFKQHPEMERDQPLLLPSYLFSLSLSPSLSRSMSIYVYWQIVPICTIRCISIYLAMSTTHLMSSFTISPIIEMGRCHPQSTSPHNTTPGHKLARSGGKSSSSMSRWIFLSWITNKNSSCMSEIPVIVSNQPNSGNFRKSLKTWDIWHVMRYVHTELRFYVQIIGVICDISRDLALNRYLVSTFRVLWIWSSQSAFPSFMSHPQVLQCFLSTTGPCMVFSTRNLPIFQPTRKTSWSKYMANRPQKGRVIQGS